MTSRSSTKVPALFGLVAGVALACSGVDHPPPIGSGGGRSQPVPPVIVEFGGTNTGGTTGQAGSISASGSLSNNFSGETSSFAGSAGEASLGGSASSVAGGGGAGDGLAGTASSFGGSFSTGGL